ncbi:polysaccharide deacetylase family protein [Arthrobacter cryoconiti]|uniref:Polysaccharide deacetylase family protein n=1 Tax=Arthrobacter cryoconiti TaxID=748907 RepID=A0ABV8QXB3_9MICC|nr:polysaccharide deacetylase family protein [Arthrobacter cryoconiti]MCC9067551.1 polysaccharide deacetylase family protein [Arthrobacter cryoconiti]
MPSHLRTYPNRSRWVTLAIVAAVVVALVFGFLVFYNSRTTPVSADTSTPIASAGATNAASNPGESTKPPQTPSPASSPSTQPVPTQPPVNPVTGRVDTLDGLVPDYKLPPIENGMVPVITKIPTTQKVVFLTIDDGAVKRDSDLQLLKDNGVKASLFLAQTFIIGQPDFYQQYIKSGFLIENHTISHNLGFLSLGYAKIKAEICGMSDFEEAHYGRRPVLMRPPGGPYSNAARQAAAECGIKAIVDWEAKANAGGMDYQVGAGLRPGDIVLMHFRPEFPADLAAFLTAQKAAGLKVVLLEDYLGVK